MATTRQKRAAKLIIQNATLDKPLTHGEIVEASGYGVSMKKNPQVITESEGVKAELAKSGFTEENAKAVVEEIMLNKEEDATARLKATDQVFKVHGTYAPEKKIVGTFDLDNEHRERATNAIRGVLSRRDSPRGQ